jgi:hypothetical protein
MTGGSGHRRHQEQLPDEHLPTARLWPGLAAGTRLPYPVVVKVVNERKATR